jgi:hypothetical protein
VRIGRDVGGDLAGPGVDPALELRHVPLRQHVAIASAYFFRQPLSAITTGQIGPACGAGLARASHQNTGWSFAPVDRTSASQSKVASRSCGRKMYPFWPWS